MFTQRLCNFVGDTSGSDPLLHPSTIGEPFVSLRGFRAKRVLLLAMTGDAPLLTLARESLEVDLPTAALPSSTNLVYQSLPDRLRPPLSRPRVPLCSVPPPSPALSELTIRLPKTLRRPPYHPPSRSPLHPRSTRFPHSPRRHHRPVT